MRIQKLILGFASMGLAIAAQGITINYTFLENGANVNLGSSSTFTENGISLTAYASPGQELYAKMGGGDENGLGIASDSDHEINPKTYIQLQVPTSPISTLHMVFLGSVQPGESAQIYWSSTLGTLGSWIGAVTGDGSFDISAYNITGYIGITAGTGNVLIDGVTATADVPDSGTTVAMLGCALTALGLARRKLV